MPERGREHEQDCDLPLDGCHTGSRSVLVWSLAAAGMLLGSSGLQVWRDWPLWMQIAIAILPIAPFVGMFISMIRYLRRMDEMQRRIQLEALGITAVASSLVFFAIGQFQELGMIAPIELTMAWVIIALLYVGAFMLVKSRYQS